MDSNHVILGILWYAVFLISLSCHEAAHAFVAMLLGDKTAYHNGQVTLNPLAHIRQAPLGMVLFPIVSYFMNGWMIGWASTPYDPAWAHRYPKRDILMSAAGPAANLLLVVLAAVIIRGGVAMGYFIVPDAVTFTSVTTAVEQGWATSFALFASILFTLNLVLFVFNLFPIPPLDGSGLVPIFLRGEQVQKYKAFISNPTVQIVGLIIVWNIFGAVFGPVHLFALNLLYPGAHYG